MKKVIALLIFNLLIMNMKALAADGSQLIRISTNETDLILNVAQNGRLYQKYFGPRLMNESDLNQFKDIRRGGPGMPPMGGNDNEVYQTSGTEDYYEPALAITHADGNMTTYLKYVTSEMKNQDSNVEETVITLKDDVYPVTVKIHYITFAKENIFKTWTEISHNEKGAILMDRYASSMLYMNNTAYYLTQFNGNWAKEVNMNTQKLEFGKKVLDTKLGSRAAMMLQPFFELGVNEPADEQRGEVLLGTIGWTGNFRFTFEVDDAGVLRISSGINPYASTYDLQPGEVFVTPEFIFTLSQEGTGKASRNFHNWARNYQLKDGKGSRLTLLNNWENTGFNFNEEILSGLMKETKELGVDMFLLDDGWFGNKYPRKDDRAGLGDWEVTHNKLPNGVPYLVKAAKEAGVKFGIWIEPEMVNPKSELFEKHPDWVIHQPNRETYYFRNQLVLDLSNPKVQDHVFGVLDKLMTENPNLAFFKWDCNSPITNIYSPYLKNKQNELYIKYVRGLYNVFNRVKAKYPNLPIMLCSGGGARCDYEALKYFTEFWASDDTDPIERLFIQWGFSQFFPAKAICAHVTDWNKATSIKFRTDVAMLCKLGFDLSLKNLTPDEMAYCKTAVANYKRLENITLDGDMYRLVSPYEGNHTATMYVGNNKGKAVLYAFDIHPRFQEKIMPVRLQGLDPAKNYQIEEINLMPGSKNNHPMHPMMSGNENPKVYSGDYLMKVGLNIFTTMQTSSHIYEITAE
ncbi:MAG: alpha-galactosidase [Parabacteroides sp.]